MLSVRSALAWSFAERYTSLVVSVAGTMVLARILTPAQVGVFSLCAAVTAVAGILRDFGISEYIIQEKALTTDKLRAALGIAIAIAWFIGAGVFLARHAIADFYANPAVADVLRVLSLNFLLLPFASPAFALLNREMAFRKIFVIQTSSNAIHAITGVGLALLGHGYMSLAWASVANTAAQTVLLTLLRPKDSLLMPSLRSASKVLSYGSMFVAARVIETLTRNAHEFVIAKQFGFAPVGVFSRAFGLMELFYNNMTAAILRVASPTFASGHRSGHSLAPSFARGTAILTSIAWPFFGFLALMSADIVRVLFGPQWDAAAPIATILAIGIMPSYLFGFGPSVLTATGNVKRRLQISMWYSPFHLIGIGIASFIGIRAVAAVWGLSNLFILMLYIKHLCAVLQASPRELFRPTVRGAAVTAISLAAQWAALALCREHQWPALANLLLVASVGAAAWIGVARTTRHPAYIEIERLVRHLRVQHPS